jgi:hypothetical protein
VLKGVYIMDGNEGFDGLQHGRQPARQPFSNLPVLRTGPTYKNIQFLYPSFP